MVRLLFLALVILGVEPVWAQCPTGASLLTFRLAVVPADVRQPPLSVRTINVLEPGQKLIYAPADIRDDDKGKITLVFVPAEPGQKLTVLKPLPAKSRAEWDVPFRTQVVALVYGPQGLDRKNVSSLVQKDQELVEQLADYAKQTEKTEELMTALSQWDESPTATDNLNAAISGFSSSYGRSFPQLDRGAPADQQVSTLIRALNPALATYDPLAQEPRQRMQQSALLASSVAGLFFGGPVGLAAGGAAIFVNMSTMLFPNTDFRSTFVQDGPSDSMSLCAKRRQSKSRTRPAYLWAVRVPNARMPSIAIDEPAHVLAGTTAKVKVNLDDTRDWRNLDGAREWRLVNGSAASTIPVKVRGAPGGEALAIDLGSPIPAGSYKLAATWDWSRIEAGGLLHVHRLDEFRPRILPESQDQLLAGNGRIPVRLTGCDFEFVESVALMRSGEKVATLQYELPKGPKSGPQQELTAFVETANLEPGEYKLSFALGGNATRDLPLRILHPHPTLAGLPLRLNLDSAEQLVQLDGSGLERIESIRCDRAQIAPREGGGYQITLGPEVKKGDRLDLLLQVEGVQEPVRVPEAIEVLGSRPKVVDAQVSLPGELGIEIADAELPAGSFVSFSLRVEPLESAPIVSLSCVEEALTLQKQTAQVGQRHESIRLRNAGANTLFLSFDPGSVGQAGCTLTAVVATEEQNASDPYELGTVVRLPRIDSFELSDEKAGKQRYVGIIQGEELELIEKVGWDAAWGVPVDGLPAPVAAGGARQSLKTALPWPSPSPHAPLYIWLRGETKGRQTTARY